MQYDRGQLTQLEAMTKKLGGGNPSPNPNGWGEWGHHVLEELKRLADFSEKLDDKQDTIRIEIAQLKVKSGVWGAVAGCIPVLIMLAVLYLRSATK